MSQQFSSIDLTYLEDMSGGNSELMKDMISIFKKQVPEMITSMKASAGAKNWEILRKNFHKAKASASIMGMSKLASHLASLEAMTNDPGFQSEAVEVIVEIETSFLRAIDELDRFLIIRQTS
jgi:HPt (histidine-containing phosphotransfer) domain-containing protein